MDQSLAQDTNILQAFAKRFSSGALQLPVRFAPVYLGSDIMRYLVKARVKPGQHLALLRAIREGSLGQGSIAGDEYIYDMEQARLAEDGSAHWVETCFCATPLAEERPYWEKYFELLSVKDAHSRRDCRDLSGTEPWACSNCDCTKKLEERLRKHGSSFLESLQNQKFPS